MAKITSSWRTGAQVPRPDRFVPAAGEERSIIRGQGDGCERGVGAAVEVGGATGLYVSLFSAEWKDIWKEDRGMGDLTYFKHDTSDRPRAFGYVYCCIMDWVCEDGEDLGLEADGGAETVFGFGGFAGCFGEGVAGEC